MLSAAALLVAAAWSQSSFTPAEEAAARRDPDAFTIDSVVIERVGPTVAPSQTAPPDTPPGDDALVLDKIINIAAKLWTIIEKNRPVVDVKTQYATAVPEGTRNWNRLDSWKPPRGTIYRLSAKNAYGITVIDVRYQVLRTYGGRYQGKGQYLTAVTVEPLLVDVLWGYKFTLASEVPDSGVINAGTSEDPLAGMLVTLKWRIETALRDSSGKGVYYVQGDGAFREVGGPFRQPSAERARARLPGLRNLF